MKKLLLALILTLSCFSNYHSQNINMDEYEIYIGDSLINKSDFLNNSKNLPAEISEKIEFKPKTDGNKIAYYLNGNIYSKGELKNHKENGRWEYWHSNGKKAREGEFIDGKPDGTHKYWYENGQLRGVGNWKKGIYNGIWEMYNESGTEKVIQNYKEGKLVNGNIP